MKAIVVWWLFTWTVLLRLTARTVQLFLFGKLTMGRSLGLQCLDRAIRELACVE